MVRIQEQRSQSDRWNTVICPNILKKLNLYISLSNACHAICNGDDQYEVKHWDNRFTVDLQKKECSCDNRFTVIRCTKCKRSGHNRSTCEKINEQGTSAPGTSQSVGTSNMVPAVSNTQQSQSTKKRKATTSPEISEMSGRCGKKVMHFHTKMPYLFPTYLCTIMFSYYKLVTRHTTKTRRLPLQAQRQRCLQMLVAMPI